MIPFSFDFVDSLCIATVLGFLCEVGDKLNTRQALIRYGWNKVAVSAGGGDEQGKGEDDEKATDCDSVSLKKRTSAIQLSPSEDRTTQRDPRVARHAHRRRTVCTSTPSLPHPEQERAGSDRTVPVSQASLRTHPSRHILRRGSDMSRTTLGTAMSSRSLLPQLRSTRRRSSQPTDPVSPPLHWALALVALAELVLSAVNNHMKGNA